MKLIQLIVAMAAFLAVLGKRHHSRHHSRHHTAGPKHELNTLVESGSTNCKDYNDVLTRNKEAISVKGCQIKCDQIPFNQNDKTWAEFINFISTSNVGHKGNLLMAKLKLNKNLICPGQPTPQTQGRRRRRKY